MAFQTPYGERFVGFRRNSGLREIEPENQASSLFWFNLYYLARSPSSGIPLLATFIAPMLRNQCQDPRNLYLSTESFHFGNDRSDRDPHNMRIRENLIS